MAANGGSAKLPINLKKCQEWSLNMKVSAFLCPIRSDINDSTQKAG